MKKAIPAGRQGFTLLLSLIIASVVLIIGLGVYGIVTRELKLSGLGRESQISFYAADAGAECALYWDLKKRAISTTTPSSIDCAGQTMTVGGSLITSFKLNFNNGSCVRVVLNKTNPLTTQVNSYGYNLDCDAVSSIKIERGIRLTY